MQARTSQCANRCAGHRQCPKTHRELNSKGDRRDALDPSKEAAASSLLQGVDSDKSFAKAPFLKLRSLPRRNAIQSVVNHRKLWAKGLTVRKIVGYLTPDYAFSETQSGL